MDTLADEIEDHLGTGVLQSRQPLRQRYSTLNKGNIDGPVDQQLEHSAREPLRNDLLELDPTGARQLLLELDGVFFRHGDPQSGDVEELPVDPHGERPAGPPPGRRPAGDAVPRAAAKRGPRVWLPGPNPRLPPPRGSARRAVAIPAARVGRAARRARSPGRFPVAASGVQRRPASDSHPCLPICTVYSRHSVSHSATGNASALQPVLACPAQQGQEFSPACSGATRQDDRSEFVE